MRRIGWLVAALVILGAGPESLASQADTSGPPGRVGRVAYLAGGVSLQVSGDTSWTTATINYPLSTGDRLYVDQGGRAEIEFGGTTLRLSDATDATVTDLTDNLLQVGLATGTARLTVLALDAGDSLEIDTPAGPLVITAPGVYRVAISPDHGTIVAVDHGALTVGGGADAVPVAEGHAVQLSGDDTLEVSDVDLPPETDFDRWAGDRDRGLAASPTAQYVSPETPGYADLDAAGAWEPDETYGPVWYPAAVPVGWAPYRYGRWVWTERWGWTWVESEPWGYAPFHYGRWVHLRRGWGWVPGPVVRRPCYAPALVVFVGVGDAGVQAWFPLGPREPYNPWYHAGDRYRRRVNGPDIDITVVDIERTRYRNRSLGFTAVSAATFRGGVPVARRTVTVRPTVIQRASIIPHPPLMPTVVAMRGRPAPRPPVARYVTTVVRPIPIRRAPPPAQPVRPAQPVVRPVTPGAPLRARRPAPPPDPSIDARQRAIAGHPGRPLEPQQVDRLRRGEPAGPQRDHEVPPDRRPAPKPAAAPAPKPVMKPAPKPPAPPPQRPAPQRPAPRPKKP